MNPSELVKGCGERRTFDICGDNYYCSECKARMEQALFDYKLFMPKVYCVPDWMFTNIEILEKALNIHSAETQVRPLFKQEGNASESTSCVSSNGRIPLNNQEVKE